MSQDRSPENALHPDVDLPPTKPDPTRAGKNTTFGFVFRADLRTTELDLLHDAFGAKEAI